MNLTYTDELLHGVEARIRDARLVPADHASGTRRTDPGFPRLDAMSGKVDGVLIGEGSFPGPAARAPRRRGFPSRSSRARRTSGQSTS